MSDYRVRTTLQPDVDLVVPEHEVGCLRSLGVLVSAEPVDPPADEQPTSLETSEKPEQEEERPAPRGRKTSTASD